MNDLFLFYVNADFKLQLRLFDFRSDNANLLLWDVPRPLGYNTLHARHLSADEDSNSIRQELSCIVASRTCVI